MRGDDMWILGIAALVAIVALIRLAESDFGRSGGRESPIDVGDCDEPIVDEA
jgi:hypothetical protein